ncbi:MAG TPA: enoyl-CoA hydratase-related protein, partial [Myxococcota bacterium]|nr:enoyl-CoA hydratase-related protein [Myxococcota bacterium]
MADAAAILVEVERGRARITLNRPEKRNALSLQLLEELHEALWDADADRAVHAVILRGAGKCFSAGYDLSEAPRRPGRRGGASYRGARSFDDDTWQLERAQRLRMALFDMHKPVIAQVHGHCLAGGTDVALLCDMVIAADDAVFGFP